MSVFSEPIRSRPLKDEVDFWRVGNLLIETYPITPLGFNWDIRRWEGKRFYAEKPGWPSPRLSNRVQLWETTAGQLVGVVNPEGAGDAHFQLHPHYRHIEADMLAWAEEHLAVPIENGNWRQIEFFVFEYDKLRQQMLSVQGYDKKPYGGVVRRLRFSDYTLEQPALAPGYTLRATRPDDMADCQQIATLLNAAFNRNFHNAQEYHNFTQLAPCFRPTLDLVAVAPDGVFAAYVGAPYDEANRHGIFEPVCTHPKHRRHGLARTLMLEGLQRLKALGAFDVSVDTGDMIPANRLYDSIGFTEVCKGYIWSKVF